MHLKTVRQKALLLRRQGYSYSFISKKTGLSKSTLSGWLGNLPFSPNQTTLKSIGRSRTQMIMGRIRLKQQSIASAKKQASDEIKTISTRDLFMFGLGLYLGEGHKNHDIVRIVNSDPRVISLAIAWFRSLGVLDNQFVGYLHPYPDSNLNECLQFWSNATRLPRSQFKKPQIDWRTNKSPLKKGKLPYGT